jgi:DNA-binding transcriptional MocR family regulator
MSPDDISKQVFDTFIKEKVLTTPGTYFKSPRVAPMTREEEIGKTFIRLSYALPSFEELEEGAKRMGRALRQEWEL